MADLNRRLSQLEKQIRSIAPRPVEDHSDLPAHPVSPSTGDRFDHLEPNGRMSLYLELLRDWPSWLMSKSRDHFEPLAPAEIKQVAEWCRSTRHNILSGKRAIDRTSVVTVERAFGLALPYQANYGKHCSAHFLVQLLSEMFAEENGDESEACRKACQRMLTGELFADFFAIRKAFAVLGANDVGKILAELRQADTAAVRATMRSEAEQCP